MSHDIKFLFPKTNKNKDLRSDNVGQYSISKPDDAKNITNLIKKVYSNIDKTTRYDLTITDATSGIGGNTISFCKNFKIVNGIEIDKTRFNYLKNNLKIYNLFNYKLYNEDMVKIIPNINQDIIFIDPPCRGKNYINFNKLDLKINNIEVSKIGDNFLEQKYCKLVVFKLPYNYNINNFNILKNKYIIKQFLIRKKILIVFLYKKKLS